MHKFNIILFAGVLLFLVPNVFFSIEKNEIIIDPLSSEEVFRLRSFNDVFQQQLDPLNPEATIFVSEQIFDGLVRLDNRFNIVPALAEYWEALPDNKTHRFYLRQGVKFHDGAELTAEDVKYSLERVVDPKTQTPYSHFFLTRIVGAEDFYAQKAASVTGIKVIDKYTIEINWTRPLTSALYLLSMHFCKILPAEQVKERGNGFFNRPSGTGPFKFDYWVRDTRLNICGVRLVRNELYFNGPSRLDALEYCPLYTLDQFFSGDIDFIPVLSERMLQSDYQILEDGSLFPVFLGMSCHIPPLSDPAVRKAIALGIDTTEIVQATYDVRYKRNLLHSYIPPQLPGLFLADDRKTFNPEEAANLFGTAGFSEENRFPRLTLFQALPRSDFKLKLYRELRRQMSELGIQLSSRYYREVGEIKKFSDPYLVIQGRLMNFPDPEDVIRPLFSSRSAQNLFGYKSEKLDKLLEQAEVASWTRRNRLFKQIQELLYADVPAVPLYSQQNRVALQPYVKGITNPPMGLNYLRIKQIWFDK